MYEYMHCIAIAVLRVRVHLSDLLNILLNLQPSIENRHDSFVHFVYTNLCESAHTHIHIFFTTKFHK